MDLPNLGPLFSIEGNGATLVYTGTGDCLRAYNPITSTTPLYIDSAQSSVAFGGGIRGVTIDMSNSTGGNALHIGDLENYEVDATVVNLSATPSTTALLLDNRLTWTEKVRVKLVSFFNEVACTLKQTAKVNGMQGGGASFGYNDLDVVAWVPDGGIAIDLLGGAWLYHARCKLRSNVNAGSGGGYVLRASGSGHGGSSRFEAVHFDVVAEQQSPGTPQGTVGLISAGNTIKECSGRLDFVAGSGQPFLPATANGSPITKSNFTFTGLVTGDENITALTKHAPPDLIASTAY